MKHFAIYVASFWIIELWSNWNPLLVKPAGAPEFSDTLTLYSQPEGADYPHHIVRLCLTQKISWLNPWLPVWGLKSKPRFMNFMVLIKIPLNTKQFWQTIVYRSSSQVLTQNYLKFFKRNCLCGLWWRGRRATSFASINNLFNPSSHPWAHSS